MARTSARKRKPKPKKKSGRVNIPAWAVGAVLALGALGVGWWLGLRPELLTAPPPEEPVPRTPALTSTVLQESLEVSLGRLGVDTDRIRKGTVDGQSGRWQWAAGLPAGSSLVRANLAVADAVERCGGKVWEAQEYTSMRTGGTSLRIALGGAASVFGWLLLEGSVDAATPTRAEPRLAIVIDDFGYSLDSVAQAFIDFPYEITLAILPGVPYSEAIAGRCVAAGRRTILHLPMEPHGYPREDPGPGAVLIDMEREDILHTFDESLSWVPGAEGVSNHMGSAATEDPVIMRVLLREISRRGLFFLDSLTSPQSVGARVAAECGVPCVTNDLFIDNEPEDRESIEAMIRRLGRRAEARGWAVGIGHPHRTTLEALRHILPELEAGGMQIVAVSDLARIEIASLHGAGSGNSRGHSARE